MEDASSMSYVAPNGEKVPIDDVERAARLAESGTRDRKEYLGILMTLAYRCFEMGMYAGAQGYFEKIFDLTDSVNAKAFCLLSIGQVKEQQEDYESALSWYRKGLSMTPGSDREIRYFLHNNLGYCLNRFERHAEAMRYCLAAIEIIPRRFNAYKNLGVALEGLGEYTEAVKSYINASLLNPEDPRSLRHVDSLLASHPKVREEIPDLDRHLADCRKAAAEISWQ